MPFSTAIRLGSMMLAMLPLACSSGCSSIMTTPAPAAAPTALSWLTNWVSPPLEPSDRFDLEGLRPTRTDAGIAVDSLLEITVWDLFEPGQPHTFPVRVSPLSRIDVPLLGEIGVEHKTIAGLESALREGYQSGEFLVHPRLLVREIDSPVVKIHVQGAVVRTGPVEISRQEATVYAALLAAGGLGKQAGTQIGVSHRPQRNTVVASAVASTPDPRGTAGTTVDAGVAEANPAHSSTRANSLEEISVAAAPPGSSAADGAAGDGAAVEPVPSVEQRGGITWYDVSRSSERSSLRDLRLSEGDVVIVKAVAPPVRISGVVAKPGRYDLPPGRRLNVWGVLEMAGGVQVTDVPVTVTILRPAAEGRGAQRLSIPLASIEQHPGDSPTVQPGDVIHLETPATRKIKKAVGDLWNK